MIIYLSMDGLHSSPYVSQVLGYVSPLAEAGADMRLLVWTRITEDRKALVEERAALTEKTFNGQARLLTRGRNLGPITQRKMIRDVREALEDWGVMSQDPVVFHARSPWMGLVALRMKQWFPHAGVITDFRGTMTAEARLVLRNTSLPVRMAGRLWIRESARAEETCATRSDHLFCVSYAFKRLLHDRYDVKRSRITMVPCFVDTDRFAFDPQVRREARREFDISPDTLALLYCGTLRYYSKNEEIMRIFKEVRGGGKKAVLLLITPDKDLAEASARKAGIPLEALRVVCGRHEEVARWLQAGDVAFLLRDQDEVNLVACPMKFAEYVRSGVKTMVTPGIGDLGEFIEDMSAGWVHRISNGLPSDLCAPYRDEDRRRISLAAGRVFGREHYIPTICNLYEELMHKGDGEGEDRFACSGFSESFEHTPS